MLDHLWIVICCLNLVGLKLDIPIYELLNEEAFTEYFNNVSTGTTILCMWCRIIHVYACCDTGKSPSVGVSG